MPKNLLPKISRGCKKIEGGNKKEGGYISTPSFFEQVENFFESINKCNTIFNFLYTYFLAIKENA